MGFFGGGWPARGRVAAAPLPEWGPRLFGFSQVGPWPIHTPFATSAVTVQPTEQCVQIFLRIATAAPGGGGGPASALRTAPSGRAPSVARPPPPRPDRASKPPRSRPPFPSPCSAAAT